MGGQGGIGLGTFSIGTTPPTLSSATVNSAATTLTCVFSESVNCSSSAGLTLTDSTQSTTPALTYSSGSGSATLVFTLATGVYSGDTCTLAYVKSSGNIVATVGSAPLASFSGTSVTNNSTQVILLFQTGSYTGTGATQNITLSRNFQPDLILIFSPSTDFYAVDSNFYGSRDFGFSTGPQSANLSISSINSNGFTLSNSSRCNSNGVTYQYFCWKKATNFFDLEPYSGTGSAQNISHNIGAVPPMYWVYDRSAAHFVFPILYSANLGASSPQSKYDQMGGSSSFSTQTDTTAWNNTSPTSSVFTVGSLNYTNSSSDTYESWIFGTSSGRSAFGTYTGNGSSSGPSISGLGFTPTLVMITPQVASSQNINMVWGNTSSAIMNNVGALLTTNFINLVSGGFNVVTTNANYNTNNQVYTYAAFA